MKQRRKIFPNEETATRFYIVVTAVALALAVVLLSFLGREEREAAGESPAPLPSAQLSGTPRPTPTLTPRPTASPEATPSPEPSGTPAGSPAPSPRPTATPTPRPQTPTPTPAPTPRVETVTKSEVARRAADALSGYAERVDVTLSAPDRVILNADVSRDKVLEKLPRATAFVLKALFPSTVTGEVEVALSVQGGSLRAEILRAEAAGRDVSGYLPDDTEEKLAVAIRGSMGAGELAKVEVTSGEVRFTYK